MFSMVGWKVMFHDKEYDCIAMKFVEYGRTSIDSLFFPTSLYGTETVILAINSDGVMETLKAKSISNFKFFK